MLNRNIRLLEAMQEKLYFTVEDLADVFQVKSGSALVLANRYTKNGSFIRLKRNFYVLRQRWQYFSYSDFLQLANLVQVPSYISFMTALNFYEITTQVQRDFFESAALKRSIRFNVQDKDFSYYKLKKEYYFGFIKSGDIFIASKEKAFVDTVYLYSFGKYKFDFSAIDINKLDKSKIKKLIKVYPEKTQAVINKLCKI